MSKEIKEFLEFVLLVVMTFTIGTFLPISYVIYKRKENEAINAASIRAYQETPSKRSSNAAPYKAEPIND